MKARRRKAQRSTKDRQPIFDLLSREEEIHSGYQQLVKRRDEYAKLQADREAAEEVGRGIHELQLVIAKLEEDTRIQLAVLDARIAELKIVMADTDGVEKERRQALREVNKIVKNRDRFLEVRDRGIFVKFHLERLETKLNQLRMETGIEKNKVDQLSLSKTGRCSECGAELNDLQSRQARSDAESILEHKRQHVEQIEREVADRESERAILRQEYVKLDKQQQQLPAAYQKLALLDIRVQQARDAAASLRIADDAAGRLRYKLENHLIGRSERQAVEEMKAKRKLLRWEPQKAEELEREIQALLEWEWKSALIGYIKPLVASLEVGS